MKNIFTFEETQAARKTLSDMFPDGSLLVVSESHSTPGGRYTVSAYGGDGLRLIPADIIAAATFLKQDKAEWRHGVHVHSRNFSDGQNATDHAAAVIFEAIAEYVAAVYGRKGYTLNYTRPGMLGTLIELKNGRSVQYAEILPNHYYRGDMAPPPVVALSKAA